MATVLDAPSALGNYMLKGWVLTDRACLTSGCRIPLLRSPAGQNPVVYFCVKCNERHDESCQSQATPATQVDVSPSTSTSSTSHFTRASTPATEVSNATDVFLPFVESEETRRRREHTDRASAEIGRRLLQGWTMLGDECPRDECYYVPLVRPPRIGGERSPKKECVLCSSIYTTEKDWAGRERLILASAGPTSQTVTVIPAVDARLPTDPRPVPVTPSSNQFHHVDILPPRSVSPSHPEQGTLVPVKTLAESTVATLDASSEALQLSLQVLTTRLTSLASNPTFADPAGIATTADAITKVIQALSQVKQLQWSETQARTMA